jgi:four helix bundle protein
MNGKRPTPNAQRSTPNGQAVERSKKYNLEERLLEYAVRIIRLVDALYDSRGANHIGGQLLRSGTSPTLHHGEVEAAESPKDFVHKLKICLKELKESRRALRVVERVPLTKELPETRSLIDETEQLIRIFFASIRTVERRHLTGSSGSSSSVVREDSPATDAGWALGVERWALGVFQDAVQEVEATSP